MNEPISPEQIAHVAINGTAGIRWEKIITDILFNPFNRSFAYTVL